MGIIEIKPEQIKNPKGIKNPLSLFGKAKLSKFDRDWTYRGTPEFELELNANVIKIEYLDGEGASLFIIEKDGKQIHSDDLKGYGICNTVYINDFAEVLKFKGELMPGSIKIHAEETGIKIEPEQVVSFSGGKGTFKEYDNKFLFEWETRPTVFNLQASKPEPTPEPTPEPEPSEPQLETGKMLVYKKDVKNKDNKTVIKGYLLYLPEDYYTSKKAYPLVIKFHGDGERGAVMDISKLPYSSDPEREITRGEKFDAVLICPQNLYTWDKENVKDADRMIEEAIKDLRIDRKRIYVTGLSKGGAATWDYAAQFPDKVAAAVPIAGWHSASLEKAVNVPIWAFHNQGDKTVGVGGTINAINELKKHGSKVAEMTIYPVGGHDAWSKTYDDQKVWEWMFKQSK